MTEALSCRHKICCIHVFQQFRIYRRFDIFEGMGLCGYGIDKLDIATSAIQSRVLEDVDRLSGRTPEAA